MDAKNDDATEASMDVAANISFMSYLNGAILFVLSIDCFFDVSLRLTFGFVFDDADPGTFGEEFLYVTAKLITPADSNRTMILKVVGQKAYKYL
jgi:hypothetical protein